MARRYPPEVRAFIAENVVGRTTRELVSLVNAQFNLDFTEGKMKAYKNNHKLKSGTPSGVPAGTPSKQFPAHVAEYIRENHKGCGHAEMANKLNEHFGTSYTRAQIKAYYANHGLNCGKDGRFQKGCVPVNKGRKGYCAPGCEKTHFRPGSLPANTKPIGYERVNKDGYVAVKVRMRPSRKDCNDNFVAKHRLIWERHHGPIPEDSVVIFKDGDKMNFDPSNLALVTRAERLEMTRRGLFSSDPALTETGIMVARLRTTVFKKCKESKKK